MDDLKALVDKYRSNYYHSSIIPNLKVQKLADLFVNIPEPLMVPFVNSCKLWLVALFVELLDTCPVAFVEFDDEFLIATISCSVDLTPMSMRLGTLTLFSVFELVDCPSITWEDM